MNRRDTIIIAVLLNAGVLAILFMLAVNERIEDEIFVPPAPAIVYQEEPKVESTIIALAPTSSQEEFVEINMESTGNAEPETNSEQYVFINEPIPVKENKAVTAVSTPVNSNEKYVEITVKRGDSLDKIARNNGSTISTIKRVNNLKSDMVTIGQVLRIPSAGQAVPVKPTSNVANNTSTKPAGTTDASYYIVKNGDSPWKIAKQNNLQLDELLRLNNLDEVKARNLKVGDKLRIK